jgi:hypothetical protein
MIEAKQRKEKVKILQLIETMEKILSYQKRFDGFE